MLGLSYHPVILVLKKFIIWLNLISSLVWNVMSLLHYFMLMIYQRENIQVGGRELSAFASNLCCSMHTSKLAGSVDSFEGGSPRTCGLHFNGVPFHTIRL